MGYGLAVGDAVGVAVGGRDVGAGVGNRLGLPVGSNVGFKVGHVVGVTVGAVDVAGLAVGSRLISTESKAARSKWSGGDSEASGTMSRQERAETP